jgi:hypothetical protein
VAAAPWNGVTQLIFHLGETSSGHNQEIQTVSNSIVRNHLCDERGQSSKHLRRRELAAGLTWGMPPINSGCLKMRIGKEVSLPSTDQEDEDHHSPIYKVV